MTCFSLTSSFKSREIRGAPLDSVPEPYDSARMKSTEMGSWICLTKSAKNKKAPVATPTTSGGGETEEKSEVI